MFANWMESCRTNDVCVGESRYVVQCNGLEVGMNRAVGEVPKQAPFAVVVGCSDARVPIEMLFGQGFNDLFVIRVAGNVLGDVCMGSIEFALNALSESVKCVVMLGHLGCGAVTGAVDCYLEPLKFWSASMTPMLRSVIHRIFVAVREGDNAIKESWGPDARNLPGYRADAHRRRRVLERGPRGFRPPSRGRARCEVADRGPLRRLQPPHSPGQHARRSLRSHWRATRQSRSCPHQSQGLPHACRRGWPTSRSPRPSALLNTASLPPPSLRTTRRLPPGAMESRPRSRLSSPTGARTVLSSHDLGLDPVRHRAARPDRPDLGVAQPLSGTASSTTRTLRIPGRSINPGEIDAISWSGNRWTTLPAPCSAAQLASLAAQDQRTRRHSMRLTVEFESDRMRQVAWQRRRHRQPRRIAHGPLRVRA